ncbi:Lymphocyte-specific helicase [Trichinella murrelli]|uniref:Lymphocyte-specific helicase n=1 Tax=Trichinella murrelli TaxID=144512 RepID=A0A0V0TVZ9_9BILA|nr:Lymphocyte-specific helicase [Trichinella murrelli]
MDGNLILNSKITEENKSPEESMDIQEAPFSHTFLLENQKTAMEKLNALMTKVEVYKNFIVEKQKHCYKRVSDESAPKCPKPKMEKTSTTVSTDRIADFENASRENALFKGTLHGYQEEGIQDLNQVNSILADEMGLGKTVQCIAFLCHMISVGVKGPFLVIAPLSTVRNWMNEFKKFAPEIPVLLYYGKKFERKKLQDKFTSACSVRNFTVFPVVVTTYEKLIRDKRIFMKTFWRYMIIDEGHRIKNSNSVLSLILRKISSDGRLLLSGTPLQNNVAELWSLLNFIMPELFGELSWFEEYFNFEGLTSANVDTVEASKKEILEKLHNLLAPFILRRLKVDVINNLPMKKEHTVFAPLCERQAKMYQLAIDVFVDRANKKKSLNKPETSEINKKKRKTRKRMKIADDNDEMDKQLLMSYISKKHHAMMCLRKVTNHPYLLSDKVIDDEISEANKQEVISSSGKMIVLDQLLEGLFKEGDHKVLIFTQFVEMIHILSFYCEYRNYKFCSLYGRMSFGQRQDEVDRFTKGEASVFLISTRAGNLGLNLMAADTVILFDSDWNPQCDLQASDRCHRIGQTKPVLIYRLVAKGTIDEIMVDRAQSKRKLEKLVIASGKFKFNKSVSEKLTEAELLEILSDNQLGSVWYSKGAEVLISDEDLKNLLDRSECAAIQK